MSHTRRIHRIIETTLPGRPTPKEAIKIEAAEKVIEPKARSLSGPDLIPQLSKELILDFIEHIPQLSAFRSGPVRDVTEEGQLRPMFKNVQIGIAIHRH